MSFSEEKFHILVKPSLCFCVSVCVCFWGHDQDPFDHKEFLFVILKVLYSFTFHIKIYGLLSVNFCVVYMIRFYIETLIGKVFNL